MSYLMLGKPEVFATKPESIVALGIDPGHYGALAVVKYDASSDRFSCEMAFTMPCLRVKQKQKKKNKQSVLIVDTTSFVEIVDTIDKEYPDYVVYLETPIILQKGLVAMSKQWMYYGYMFALFKCRGRQVYSVHPSSWKSKLLGNKKGKDLALEYVASHYGKQLMHFDYGISTYKMQGFLSGIADAVCIAEYGIRYSLGQYEKSKSKKKNIVNPVSQ
jgi:hypothetical protein